MTIHKLKIHFANRPYWARKMVEVARANPANDEGLLAVYYDAQACCYNLADSSFDPSTWYPLAEDAAKPYRDFWVLGKGAGQGWRYFPQGLAEDYLRTGNLKAKAALNKLLTSGYCVTNSTFGNPWGEPYLQGEHGTRETAYAMMTHFEAKRVGLVYDPARIEVLYQYALKHLDMGINGTGTYIRPFMYALTAKALIQYNDTYRADPIIKTKLTKLFEKLWSKMWGAVDEHGSKSFKYTDIDTAGLGAKYTNAGGTIDNPAYNSGGIEPTTNLNLLIVPVFGWLYSVTSWGRSKWKTRGDEIFENGISVYNSTYTEHLSGAYFGTATNPKGKEINQNLWWSDRYLAWTGLLN